MAARSKRKKSVRHGGTGGSAALFWFIAGLALGVGISGFLFLKGYLPDRPDSASNAERRSAASEPELIGGDSPGSEKAEPRYDFFTVLPEMEVVVPDRELSSRAQPESTGEADARFILQVGSFRSASDAEEMKARLALRGMVAYVQKVTVNGVTWHRVRIGPVTGARQADELRRKLQDNDLDVLVLKGSS